MRSRLAIVSFAAVLCLMSVFGGFCIGKAWGAETYPVIGKVEIPKDLVLRGVSILNDKAYQFTFVSFEDQTLYITKEIMPKEGIHNGGYIIVADDFAHNCPTHGEEILAGSRIVLTHDKIAEMGLTVVLFKQGMPNSGDGATN